MFDINRHVILFDVNHLFVDFVFLPVDQVKHTIGICSGDNIHTRTNIHIYLQSLIRKTYLKFIYKHNNVFICLLYFLFIKGYLFVFPLDNQETLLLHSIYFNNRVDNIYLYSTVFAEPQAFILKEYSKVVKLKLNHIKSSIWSSVILSPDIFIANINIYICKKNIRR